MESMTQTQKDMYVSIMREKLAPTEAGQKHPFDLSQYS